MVKRTTVLWAIARHEPATAREIAHELDAPTTGVGAALGRLYDDEGLVDRARRPSGGRGPDPYEYRLADTVQEALPERAADD